MCYDNTPAILIKTFHGAKVILRKDIKANLALAYCIMEVKRASLDLQESLN